MTAKARKAAPEPPKHDEGEPQMDYLHPQEGGTYTRNADGTLTRVAPPTKTHQE